MSKELDKQRCGTNVEKVIIDEFVPTNEALESLKEIESQPTDFDKVDRFLHYLSTLEQALLKAQEQEKILDNNLVFENGHFMSEFSYKGKQIVAMPLEGYDKFMEQEKENAELKRVLEIAFKKRIDLESFYSSFVENDYDYNFYERRYGTYGKYELTQEEFDLLKRYFK